MSIREEKSNVMDHEMDNEHSPSSSPQKDKIRLYLIDMTSPNHNLQYVIDNESLDSCMVYCFCDDKPPKIPLGFLGRYSEWIHKKKLCIVEPHKNKKGNAFNVNISQTLAFWAGKLTYEYKKEDTKIFISSDDTQLFNIILTLRQQGYTVESSWPDMDSVQCNDEILCGVMKVIQQQPTPPPTTLDAFMEFLKTECRIPYYISLESVVRQMQSRGFITVRRDQGELAYEMPIFLEESEIVKECEPKKIQAPFQDKQDDGASRQQESRRDCRHRGGHGASYHTIRIQELRKQANQIQIPVPPPSSRQKSHSRRAEYSDRYFQ